MLVIGFGSGRSGTASLSRLLNGQADSICFHELNPACVKYEGTVAPILNTIREFRAILGGGDPTRLTVDFSRKVSDLRFQELIKMPRVRLIGDIAHYYLRYLEEIHALDRDVRMLCLKRDREQTIESWLKKSAIGRWRTKSVADYLSSIITRTPYYRSTNHWMEHDGTVYAPDPVWDKCFPKYDAANLRDAIGMYYDDYYERAEQLIRKFPDNVLMVATESLNTAEGQTAVLDFIGYPAAERLTVDAHVHKSAG